MFEAVKAKKSTTPRQVRIALRDGRVMSGVLHLKPTDTASSLLAKAMPFLTIRTSRGEIAINRADIASFEVGGTAAQDQAAPKPANDKAHAAHARPIAPAKAQWGFDPCRILDVRPGASREELKAAWRKRISECHPDRVSARGASEDVVKAAQRQAALVNSAYQTLLAMRPRKNAAAA
ncbi:J domain-containing protein [Parvularcula lutaonensis]|uniref:DnaJ family molecular chaperone n=1 Tax=Parvularcula lutaonensis TaxID=491923 RepID=A0ABV7MF33_9PROT|nr:J domain-containing protein [Parvularcula lutaonensis]GGY53028.1 hypothetical protein GCM10007148_22820 [Parvularcula lutaonensis]